MKVNVQTPGFDADIKLVSFIEKKLNKLEQFYDKIIFADVFLKIENNSEPAKKTVEILLSIPKGDLMVKKDCIKFEVGVDECVQSLQRQLKKRKEKQRAHI
ncbi:ribosome-associated translation inhibitor RaiA [uncultured Planktosalinus sp.]|uniref:ribosome hibernation-promoting factor, HPF/YfiA family n=1 Tax=uncultured Planktosalinus sp. TaxID=1810935 RepID=UPI0030D6D0E0